MIMPFVCLAVENTPINEEADIKERQINKLNVIYLTQIVTQPDLRGCRLYDADSKSGKGESEAL